MGTDIHGILQSRWSSDSNWFDECEIEDDRNYRLFAALAGVRNGYGFAGVYRHEPLEPIAGDRGIPDDFKMSDETHGYRKTWMGDHSYTWMTLDEIINWDGWDKKLAMAGYISRQQYENWKPGTSPDSWSGDVRVPGKENADHNKGIFPDGWEYIRVEWADTTVRECCETFLRWIEYAKSKCGNREARIVIGFDS